MIPYTEQQRVTTLLQEVYGEEGLSFATERISDFFQYVFSSPCKREPPNIMRLLHTHNDILKLIEAGYLLLNDVTQTTQASQDDPLQKAKQILSEIKNWDDFPSHLKPAEWCNPETVLEEFFSLQTIDEWNDAMQGLLESAITDTCVTERLTVFQLGFVVIQIHRVVEAVWLWRFCGRIKTISTAKADGRLCSNCSVKSLFRGNNNRFRTI